MDYDLIHRLADLAERADATAELLVGQPDYLAVMHETVERLHRLLHRVVLRGLPCMGPEGD